MHDILPIVQLIRSELALAANPANAIPMQKYMKSAMPYRGVKSPEFKPIMRNALKTHPIKDFAEWVKAIQQLWNAKFREERYAAIYILMHYNKFWTMEAVPLVKYLIQSGAWWDLVDGLATHVVGGILRKEPLTMRKVLDDWINDEDVWLRRTAILAQEKFGIETDEEMLFRYCEICLHENIFWIQKAIGWVLRSYSKHNAPSVRRFYDKHHAKLSTVSKREILKYI